MPMSDWLRFGRSKLMNDATTATPSAIPRRRRNEMRHERLDTARKIVG